jgi:hypothetical protein
MRSVLVDVFDFRRLPIFLSSIPGSQSLFRLAPEPPGEPAAPVHYFQCNQRKGQGKYGKNRSFQGSVTVVWRQMEYSLDEIHRELLCLHAAVWDSRVFRRFCLPPETYAAATRNFAGLKYRPFCALFQQEARRFFATRDSEQLSHFLS